MPTGSMPWVLLPRTFFKQLVISLVISLGDSGDRPSLDQTKLAHSLRCALLLGPGGGGGGPGERWGGGGGGGVTRRKIG